jgi:hypothetical protein
LQRQPFSMRVGQLPVPAVTDTAHNFVFADYEGVKALDHDDGEPTFNCVVSACTPAPYCD